MTEETIEGGHRRPGSPLTLMDLSAQHDDPYGFAADNDLDIVGARRVGADLHWQISYRNKHWLDSGKAAVEALADLEAAEADADARAAAKFEHDLLLGLVSAE